MWWITTFIIVVPLILFGVMIVLAIRPILRNKKTTNELPNRKRWDWVDEVWDEVWKA